MPNDDSDPSPLDGLPVAVNDRNDVWPTLRIANVIPLSRLEWLWNSRGTSIRDSSASARAVFEVSNVKAPVIQVPSRFPHDWYRNPYVYIIITTLQELESSRDAGLARVRSFIEDCREKNNEYLVLLAATETDVEKQRRTVDRLRAEVNVAARGRERLVMVPPAAIREEQRPITHLHHSPSHQDLLVRLRECIREGAEARIQNYEEEVSRTYLNRSAKGWSFGEFFVLKEGMAFVFVQLGRRDLAVRFYDELHSMMAERDDKESIKFCDQPATDAAMGVTDPCMKDYRALFIANTITEIDMRSYLFAKQLTLLVKDRKFADIAERGLKFITAIARRCAEEGTNSDRQVSGVFRDIWVFASSRALAAALTPAIPSLSQAENELTAQLSTPRERHTARLIAGFHVHALKALIGLAHLTLPGVLAPSDYRDLDGKSALIAEATSTSDERLKEALLDAKNAECLHAEISNAAASLYEMGGRARGAAALDGDAGLVRLRNKSYTEAEKLLSAQCSRFINDNGWDDLHSKQRIELARAERALDRVQEYLVSCLTMLYMSRSGRRRWRTAENSDEEVSAYSVEASYWTQETISAAKRLPRVMKYKAERLFDVSVKPNERIWMEGDPGDAIVRIKSDIPTTFKVDYIILECQCTSVLYPQTHKSALHNRNGPENLPYQMEEESSTSASTTHSIDQSQGVSVANDAGDNSDTVLLRSKTPVNLEMGVNDILVHIDGLPQFGRYKAMVVALFVGNLKLVQVASRATTLPIVTIKGGVLSKNSATSTSMSGFADYNNGEVKFPMFFAAQRRPSAFLRVSTENPLLLAPNTLHFLHVKIIAGHHGIKEGSKLACALLNDSGLRPISSSQFVAFTDTPSKDIVERDEDPPIIRVKRVLGESERFFDKGEVIIEKQLEANEVFESVILVRTSEDCAQFRDPVFDEDSEDRSCTLHLQLTCFELYGPNNRSFVCEAEQRLVFRNPVEVSARIELSSEWGDDDTSVSRAVGLDGTPLGEGGTLVCSVRSRTGEDNKITILDTQLELPPWIELRPDEPPAHVDLLPCAVGNESSFTCAFDVLLREEAANSENYVDTGANSKDNVIFDTLATERRLSRAIASSSAGGGEDDISHWAHEKRSHLSLNEENGTPGSGANSLEQNLLDNGSSSGEQFEEALQDIDVSRANATKEYLTVYEKSAEDEETINLKEAADVVDLSAPNGQGERGSPDSASEVGGETTATLRLTLCFERINFITVFWRKINMHALRGLKRRYRIERTIRTSGGSGKLMELQFTVQMTTSGGLVSATTENDETENKVVQYEVDADPTVWMLVGRRRGELNTARERTKTGIANLIPLVSGRQRVPSIRLFTQDGRGLPFSQYENIDEHLQVTVSPNRNIVSTCTVKRMERTESDTLSSSVLGANGRGSMPVVIASDSFFES